MTKHLVSHDQMFGHHSTAFFPAQEENAARGDQAAEPVRMRPPDRRLASVHGPRPLTSKRGKSVGKLGPSTNRREKLVGKLGPSANRRGKLVGKLGRSANRRGKSVGKLGPSANRRGKSVGKLRPSARKLGEWGDKLGPLSEGQGSRLLPGIVHSETAPTPLAPAVPEARVGGGNEHVRNGADLYQRRPQRQDP